MRYPAFMYLLLVLHLFIGATLAGVGIVVVLVSGLTGALWLWGSVVAGLVLAFPVAWYVARAMTGGGSGE